MVSKALGYVVLGVMVACLLPLIALIAARDWWHLWRGHVLHMDYFIKEHPASEQAWREQMSRAREMQRREEDGH